MGDLTEAEGVPDKTAASGTSSGGDVPPTFSSEVLGAAEWSGTAAFRALSYCFSVQWNWEPLGRHLRRVFGALEVSPEVGRRSLPPRSQMASYSLIRVERPSSSWYWVLAGENAIFGTSEPGSALDWFYWRLNADILDGSHDFFVVHAGAVVTPSGDGVLLPGASGAGKSSLVAALVRSGFQYLSDEFAAIDPVARQLYAMPKAMALKVGSFELFDGLRPPSGGEVPMGANWHIAGDEVGEYGGEGPHPIRWVIAPRYQLAAPTTLVAMTPAATAYTLGVHSPSLWTYGKRALPLLAEVSRGASGFELISADLAEAVDAVRAVTANR